MDVFVGDKVRTPDGEGFVEEVTRWRDHLLTLSDAEAREFAADCRRECGPDYKESWGRIVVRVNSRARSYPLARIVVLEGRDAIR